MSLYSHDLIAVNVEGTFRYFSYLRNIEKLYRKNTAPFNIRLDNDYCGIARIYNHVPARIKTVMGHNRDLVINMYDPFYEGYRVKV